MAGDENAVEITKIQTSGNDADDAKKQQSNTIYSAAKTNERALPRHNILLYILFKWLIVVFSVSVHFPSSAVFSSSKIVLLLWVSVLETRGALRYSDNILGDVLPSDSRC